MALQAFKGLGPLFAMVTPFTRGLFASASASHANVVSHSQGEVLGDRVLILAQGELRFSGSPLFLKHEGVEGGDQAASYVHLTSIAARHSPICCPLADGWRKVVECFSGLGSV